MPFETSIEQFVEKKVDIIEVRVVKVARGFEVMVKSPLIAKWMKGIAGKGDLLEIAHFGGFKVHPLPEARTPHVSEVNFGNPASDRLMDGTLLNGIFFRSPALEEGLLLKDAAQALPNINYGKGLGRAIHRTAEELYVQHIAPYDVKFSLSSREMHLVIL